MALDKWGSLIEFSPASISAHSRRPVSCSAAVPEIPSAAEVTRWLSAWRTGDADARDRLFAVVEPSLRHIAGHLLQRERRDHTLEPGALVNELYLRLTGGGSISYQDRAHFLAIAAQTMRRILIDHARARSASK